ncbi:MAG: DNA cytosine methyltransferase [Saprospiraceae bacterium]|nr:DNA cytosine methyltransferase [Saprospiraceae bacterium]
MKHISLFNGISTTLYAAELTGWQNIAASENSAWCNRHQAQRFPHVETLGDITTADFTRFAGVVDVLTGGFPCQNISPLGRGEGIRGAKSSLWAAYRRAIEEIRPRYALIENSSRINTRGIETVLHDLAGIGYDAEWCNLSAAEFGADHIRNRMWILAYPVGQRRRSILHIVKIAGMENNGAHECKTEANEAARTISVSHTIERLRQSYGEPPLLGDYDGLTARLDTPRRIHGIGNAMYWPIPYAIFRWIDYAEQCTEEEWDMVNYLALEKIRAT